MSHLRHQIALDVGASFLPAKRQAIDAAAASFECVATLLKARQRARFAPDEAGDVVALAVEAANASYAAQDALPRPCPARRLPRRLGDRAGGSRPRRHGRTRADRAVADACRERRLNSAATTRVGA